MTRMGRGAASAWQTAEFDVGDIHCYLDPAEPHTCYCVPGTPTPERDAAGAPTLSLWVIPAHNRLQLGTQWGLSPADIAAVQAAADTRGRDPGGPQITVAVAPLHVDAAVLMLGADGQPSEQIATSKTAGFGAFPAVFTAVLDDAHTALVTSALGGAPGRLFVEYHATLDRAIPVSVTLAGNVSAELAMAAPPLSDEQARELIEQALAAGHLTLTRQGPDAVGEAVWAPLREELIDDAVLDLHTMATRGAPATATLHREACGSYDASTPLTRRADIADWFPGGASRHIRVLSVPPSGRQ
ncbi:hypothetical protein ACGFK1_31650 [Mycobacterium sp. NPDC048908]|uniref:hypothetical protein n=1 Tax=Mycobacterium sp. NPDC048908 TaxID=3364292 RepID=UPI0037115365